MSYSFGFNGMERDDEVKGDGNSLDFGARIYDPRLGRFMSIDPWTAKYPWQTPYSYYRNSPISIVDYLGLGGEDDKWYNNIEFSPATVYVAVSSQATVPKYMSNILKLIQSRSFKKSHGLNIEMRIMFSLDLESGVVYMHGELHGSPSVGASASVGVSVGVSKTKVSEMESGVDAPLFKTTIGNLVERHMPTKEPDAIMTKKGMSASKGTSGYGSTPLGGLGISGDFDWDAMLTAFGVFFEENYQDCKDDPLKAEGFLKNFNDAMTAVVQSLEAVELSYSPPALSLGGSADFPAIFSAVTAPMVLGNIYDFFGIKSETPQEVKQ